jgi:hypothetical protein
MMFVNHCTACDREQLIFPSMLTAATTGEHGLEVAYTCWCGAEQTHRPVAGQPRDARQLVG